jgi:hypothetical protein
MTRDAGGDGFKQPGKGEIMESTSRHEAGLMAAWRATGGAGGATREASGQDEGLAAFGLSRSVLYCGDDGLTATQYTDPYRCVTDDGLAATARTAAWHCIEDDGLKAGTWSTPVSCGFHGPEAGAAPTIGAFCW